MLGGLFVTDKVQGSSPSSPGGPAHPHHLPTPDQFDLARELNDPSILDEDWSSQTAFQKEALKAELQTALEARRHPAVEFRRGRYPLVHIQRISIYKWTWIIGAFLLGFLTILSAYAAYEIAAHTRQAPASIVSEVKVMRTSGARAQTTLTRYDVSYQWTTGGRTYLGSQENSVEHDWQNPPYACYDPGNPSSSTLAHTYMNGCDLSWSLGTWVSTVSTFAVLLIITPLAFWKWRSSRRSAVAAVAAV